MLAALTLRAASGKGAQAVDLEALPLSQGKMTWWGGQIYVHSA